MLKYTKKIFSKKIYKTNKPTIDTSYKHETNLYLQILSTIDKNTKDNEIKSKLATYSEIGKIDDTNISNLIKNKEENNSDTIQKIIEEELSEEEFANDKNVRFIRPPHSLNELKFTLEEAERIYEENKDILLSGDNKIEEEKKENFLKNIPKYFSIRNLYYPPTDTEIIILGVQRNSSKHALFLSKLLERIEPDMIGVQLSPDIPLFINSSKDYLSDWKEFLNKNSDYKFLINPYPTKLYDILFTPKKLERLYNINLASTENFKISPEYIMSKQKTLLNEVLFCDNFLTPLVYSYYSKDDKYCPVVIADYPQLQYYLDIINNVKIDNLKEVFKIYCNELEKCNFYFNYEILERNCNFLDKRLNYNIEVIRQMCYTSKKVCMIVNYQHIDKLVLSWKNMSNEINSLESFYVDMNINKELYFMDFIEKLVILDIMNGGYINDNFIIYKTFPYKCVDNPTWTMGYKNLFQLWNHYNSHYSNLIRRNQISLSKYNEFVNSFNSDIL